MPVRSQQKQYELKKYWCAMDTYQKSSKKELVFVFTAILELDKLKSFLKIQLYISVFFWEGFTPSKVEQSLRDRNYKKNKYKKIKA